MHTAAKHFAVQRYFGSAQDVHSPSTQQEYEMCTRSFGHGSLWGHIQQHEEVVFVTVAGWSTEWTMCPCKSQRVQAVRKYRNFVRVQHLFSAYFAPTVRYPHALGIEV